LEKDSEGELQSAAVSHSQKEFSVEQILSHVAWSENVRKRAGLADK
jgi:hypothetical protein